MSDGRARALRRLPLARLAGPVLWAAARLRVAQWDHTMARRERLRRAQLTTLRALVEASARTEIGRRHGFEHVRAHEDFARRVPVRTYADFEPYLERMRRGEQDVLYPGFVYHWGQSSGSSNTAAKNKFLPISREQIRWQQRAGFDVLARYLTLWSDRAFPGGYMLGLFPPSTIERVGPVGVASNPGIMQLHVPRLVRPIQLPQPPLRDIPDYGTKLRAMAEAYVDHDVWSLTGTTCWFSVLFDHVLEVARRRRPEVRSIREVWPNLRVLLAGGVPAEPYRPLIERRVGGPIAMLESYSATEGGFLATADARTEPGMLMIPDRGVFFELVPRGDDRRVPLWDAEVGVDYGVVLTTSSGLFAYDTLDFIRFTSVFPHRMEFVGRAAGVLSLTQELTTTLEIERAVAHAARAHHATVVDFTASSELGVQGSGKGRYLLFVELEAPVDPSTFARAFDAELCAQNRVYREHRQGDVAILPPEVALLAPGATRRLADALGTQTLQQKFPHIVGPERVALLRAHVR